MSLNKIREHLEYLPDTGLFVCRKQYSNKVPVGAVAGSVNARGYIDIRFMNVRYYGHRLAWWWVHGKMPESEVDHIDGNPSNNAISNLRPAKRGSNVANAPRRKASGFKGVYRDRRTGRWAAKVRANYKQFHLGVFDNEKDAARAYDAAAIRHFGEFARLNFPRRAL